MAKLTPEAQCEANVRQWLRWHGLNSRLPFTIVQQDRVLCPRDAALENAIHRMYTRGILEKRYAGNHGKSVIVGYREASSRCSAQVIIHSHAIEIDFDYWNPWDVIGYIMHGWEVLSNKVKRKQTDPFQVASQLAKRGINVADTVSV